MKEFTYQASYKVWCFSIAFGTGFLTFSDFPINTWKICLSRQAVYDRINGLNIKPVARGKINSQQLDLLDKLDKHIKQGGVIADFPIQPEIEVTPLEKLDNSLDILDNPPDNSESLTAINVMAGLIEKMMEFTAGRRSPLAEYEELEKAIAHKLILSINKVKELIGVTSKVGKD